MRSNSKMGMCLQFIESWRFVSLVIIMQLQTSVGGRGRACGLIMIDDKRHRYPGLETKN